MTARMRWQRVSLWSAAVVYVFLYFQLSQGATGDGFYTYLMVESVSSDFDLDLHNQFAEAGNPWGYAEDPDTGYLRMRYELWPLLVWTPFMALGKAAAALGYALGVSAAPDSIVQSLTLLASPLSALLGAFFLGRLLARYVDPYVAWLVALGTITASHLVFYSLASPAYAHTLSFALTAWLLERCDAYARAERGPSLWQTAALGALVGALMNTRPQSAVFALLTLWPLGSGARAALKPKRWLSQHAALLAAVAALAFAPTLLLFQRVYGSPFETFQGSHFMRWGSPWLGAAWFSSAGGLFSYSPLAWLGVIGLFTLACGRALRVPALLMLLCFLIHSYINACAWDYWGGAAFGARRASELLALCAVGAAVLLAQLLRLFEHRPRATFAWLGSFALLFQTSLYLAASEAALDGSLALRGPTTFSQRARAVAARWAQGIEAQIGDPFAFPANALFSLRYDVAPWQYSCIVGRSFLEPSAADQRFRGPELIDLSKPADACLLGEGFARPPKPEQGWLIRKRSARVLLPVHTPTRLRLHVRHSAAKSCKVLVLLDGSQVGGFAAQGADQQVATLEIDASLLRSDVQVLDLVTSEPACLRLAALLFEPLSGP